MTIKHSKPKASAILNLTLCYKRDKEKWIHNLYSDFSKKIAFLEYFSGLCRANNCYTFYFVCNVRDGGTSLSKLPTFIISTINIHKPLNLLKTCPTNREVIIIKLNSGLLTVLILGHTNFKINLL